ncbi:MAG: YihY/virulence factor BrkB family protein [Capsulimonadaceae bacterium]
MHNFQESLDKLRAGARKIAVLRFISLVVNHFGRDNMGLLAAGLAFFTGVAFVPLLLIGIAGLGYYFHLLHHTDNAVAVIKQLLMTQIMPGAAGQEVQHLMRLVDIPGKVARITETRGMSGLVGTVGLIWVSIQVYANAAVAMNVAWKVREQRNWLQIRLISLGLLFVGGLFMIVSLVSTAYGVWLDHSPAARYMPQWSMWVNIGSEAAAMLGSAAMYSVIYRYLPSAPVTWRSAIVGGAFSAIAWEIAKKGLAVYLLHPNTSLYGNMANLILFVLWIYYSMLILLMGAEVCVVYHREVEIRRSGATRTAGAGGTADFAPSPDVPATEEGVEDFSRSTQDRFAQREGSALKSDTPSRI